MPNAQMEEGHRSALVHDAPRRRGPMSPPGRFGEARALVRTIGSTGMVRALELGQLASLVKTMSLRMAGGETDPAFVAPQRIQGRPATSTRPVLLVHGFGGTKSSWYFVARALAAKGLTVDAISYTPFGTSVERLADRLAVEVERMLSQTGADKVHLIGHSLGGVVIAQAIATGRLAGKVDTIVTLGAPFGGSPWAHLVPFGTVVRALRGGSPLLRRLSSKPVPEGVRWLAITATLDVVVPGVRSVPAHADVETMKIDGVGHLGMLLSPTVAGSIVAALAANHQRSQPSEARSYVNPVALAG
jgi:triacylglycerol lipase